MRAAPLDRLQVGDACGQRLSSTGAPLRKSQLRVLPATMRAFSSVELGDFLHDEAAWRDHGVGVANPGARPGEGYFLRGKRVLC